MVVSIPPADNYHLNSEVMVSTGSSFSLSQSEMGIVNDVFIAAFRSIVFASASKRNLYGDNVVQTKPNQL